MKYFDAFVSYAHQDRATAEAACASLESAGIRCWIAPRDIVAGSDWGASIIDAIASAKVMVLIFSGSANASEQIKREVERAVNAAIPIIPYRIQDVAMSKSLQYFLSTVHWLDALPPPPEQHFDQLVASARALLGVDADPAQDGYCHTTTINFIDGRSLGKHMTTTWVTRGELRLDTQLGFEPLGIPGSVVLQYDQTVYDAETEWLKKTVGVDEIDGHFRGWPFKIDLPLSQICTLRVTPIDRAKSSHEETRLFPDISSDGRLLHLIEVQLEAQEPVKFITDDPDGFIAAVKIDASSLLDQR